MFDTLEDIKSALTAAVEGENLSKFAEGDVLALALENGLHTQFGMTRKQFMDWAGTAVGKHQRTMYYRLKVAKTFAPEERVPSLSWETHLTAALTDKPQYWLSVAAAGQLTPVQLEHAIKTGGEAVTKPEKLFLLRSTELWAIHGDGVWVLYGGDVTPPDGAMRVLVTMTAAEEAAA